MTIHRNNVRFVSSRLSQACLWSAIFAFLHQPFAAPAHASPFGNCTVSCGPAKTLEPEAVCTVFDVACESSNDCPANEPCDNGLCTYVDHVNGGCDESTAQFIPIECGQSICGTSGTFCGGNCTCELPEDVNRDGDVNLLDLLCVVDGITGLFDNCTFEQDDISPCGGDGHLNLLDAVAVARVFSGLPGCCGPIPELRDTDWYHLELPEDRLLMLSGAAEFEARYRLFHVPDVTDHCANLQLITEILVDPCESINWSDCLPAGNYYVSVEPVQTTDVPCGAQYTLTVDCDSCAQLCGPGEGDCCQDGGNGTALCEDVSCCEIVCDIDSTCCSGTWDSDCAALARNKCEVCPPPASDECETATLIDVPITIEGTTLGSQTKILPTCSNVQNTAPGVWYKVIGTGNRLAAHTCLTDPSFDTKLTVFCSDCDTPRCVTANDNIPGCGFRSRVEWCTDIGAEYLIFVHGEFSEKGDFVLVVSDNNTPCTNPPDCGVAICGDNVVGGGEECDDGNRNPGDGCDENCMLEAPLNDSCSDALAILASNTPLAFDTRAATTDGPPHPTCLFSGNNQVNNDIWFNYTAECNGTAFIETCGSTYDTKLTVYDRCDVCPVADNIKLDCDDDTCGFQSRTVIAATQGQCYKIRVGADQPTGGGLGTLTVTCQSVVPQGACCVDQICVGTTSQEDCLAQDGLWSIGETCPLFACRPPNDECTGRISVSCGQTLIVDNTNATNAGDDPEGSCWLGNGSGTVFLEFVAAGTSMRFRTDTVVTPPATDSEFAVYSVNQSNVCDKSAWVEVGCSEDEGTGAGFFMGNICVQNLIVGNIYIIELGAFAQGTQGRYTLAIQCPCP